MKLSDILTWLPYGIMAALAVWILVSQGAKISRFCGETWTELKKCSWPWNPQETGVRRYRELLSSTVVVAISSLLLAAFVTSSDFILVQVVGVFTRMR